ncbi:MAG: mRNA surveillance protein pelota [Candidatus Nanoarchaeia archaeon]|nr:mRNA surveillance protein pelota [Candidatus Nanoarchaeia archaeon]MDD5239555.1 mRNA surveillance protein pelota [Candidatus Nanoarchaeia archaeon]
MKILSQDLKNNSIKVRVDNLDDLWILSRIIEPLDAVAGETTRITKKEEGQEGIRKKIYVRLGVEKVEFKKHGDTLRILGTISESSNEDVPHGEYHALSIGPGRTLEIFKVFQKWHLERLKDAEAASKQPRLLLCAADYGEADIAVLREFGIEHISELSKSLPGKKKETMKEYDKSRSAFMEELAKMLDEISKSQGIGKIILGGPGFFAENFEKSLERMPELKKRIVFVKISSAGKPGINEIIKRGEVDKVVKGSRVQEETQIIERFFGEVSKSSQFAVYGVEDVQKAVEFGAVDLLLVSDYAISKHREAGTFEVIDQLMRNAESGGARIMIISDEHESGERFSKIEVAAMLRFPIG